MNNSDKPLVSVIIPCYNQALYLSECLESLLNQTYPMWEGIIVNDDSPDDTEQIAFKYVEKDSRFKYLHKANGGVSAARNYGITNAEGEFILPLDADDKISPGYLNMAIEIFCKMPDVRLVYCFGELFGIQNEPWDMYYKDYKTMLYRNSIFNSSIYRKADCVQIKGYDEDMLLGYEDWEFYIRLLDESSVVYQIPEVLFSYRIKELSRNVIANKEDNSEKLLNYIYFKNFNKYIESFSSAIDVLRKMICYKEEMEKFHHKYKNEWFRRGFRWLKYLLKGKFVR